MTKLIGIKQARQYLGCGSTHLNQLMASGRLPYVQHTPGGKRWIEQKSLDDFISAGRISGWKTEVKPRTKPIACRAGWLRSTKGPGTIARRERKNSDGSLYAYYEGRISLGKDSAGRRIRRTVTAGSEDECQAALDKIDRRPKTNLDAERTTLDGYLTDWLEDVKANKRINTWRALDSVVKLHVKPHIGNLRLVDVGPDQIRRLLQRLRSAGVGSRICRRVRSHSRTARHVVGRLSMTPCRDRYTRS